MLPPPCRLLLPSLPSTRHRRRAHYELSSAQGQRGPRLNLNWALNLLAAIPGPHQQRILSSGGPDARAASQRAAAFPQDVQEQSGQQGSGVSKEELGRSTWTLLHMLAAQWPEQPSRQQQKDLASLMDVLTRIYPCADCAAHFKDVVRRNPPRAKTQQELQQWMCEAHNTVNERLGKPQFNCCVASLRWPALDCDTAGACALSGTQGGGRA